ncbi:unnamed protein product [Amoebophrya sp. A25]|nr:unnamed protein product [Amoebophrya sp. A25]|eukprot:GSA25T00014788001.1
MPPKAKSSPGGKKPAASPKSPASSPKNGAGSPKNGGGGKNAGAKAKAKAAPTAPEPKGKAKAKSSIKRQNTARLVPYTGDDEDRWGHAGFMLEKKSNYEKLQEDHLRFRTQYQPDSSLLTLAQFPKGSVYIDPHHISIIDQANALVMQDREDVNQIGYKNMTPLYMAARTGNVEMGAYLLERGARLDMADADGMTPLHIAVLKKQSLATVHTLCNKVTGNREYLISKRNNGGFTPLHLAVLNCDRPMIKLLIEMEADPLERNEILSNDTALHMAVREDRQPPESHEVIEDLLFSVYKRAKKFEDEFQPDEAKALMNPQNAHGDTPLHAAGFHRAVEILLTYHCAGNIQNHDGKYPFEVCRAGPTARAVLNSLLRKAPLRRRTDLRFDLPTVDNALRFEHKQDVHKKFTLL